MKTSSISRMAIGTIVISLFISALSAGSEIKAQAQNESGIQEALLGYSNSLKAGSQLSISEYSAEITDLIKERQNFYKYYFANGLHSELLEINSCYSKTTIDPTTSGIADQTVHTVEVINLTGVYSLTDPAEYPMVQAALLASEQSKDERVKQELKAYASRTIDDVGESLKNGSFIITWELNHTIVYDPVSGKIVKDAYSDIASDRLSGTDIVNWNSATFSRQWPDISYLPDYEIYHTSIEDLAKGLLEQYEVIFGGLPISEFFTQTYTYSHTGAGNYIRTWVKATTSTCSDGSTLQNTSNYNPSYTAYQCVDCTNYVSQALRYGGLPVTSLWTPYTTAWVNVSSLQSFIIDNGRGQIVASLSYLGIGDIAMIPATHVVMVSAISPTRYSGHTNDRLNASWDASINRYILIFVNPIL